MESGYEYAFPPPLLHTPLPLALGQDRKACMGKRRKLSKVIQALFPNRAQQMLSGSLKSHCNSPLY